MILFCILLNIGNITVRLEFVPTQYDQRRSLHNTVFLHQFLMFLGIHDFKWNPGTFKDLSGHLTVRTSFGCKQKHFLGFFHLLFRL